MGTTPLITTNNPQNTRSTKPDQATFEALCGAVCCGASGMSRAIPQAVFQGFEMGSLGLQRSWGCRGKFGHPNCMRLVGLWVVRRVDRTPVFVCRPKDAAYHTWGCVRLVRVRFAVLLDEAVVARVGNQRRGERYQQRKHSASKDSIQQGRETARDYISLWPLPSVCCGGVLLSHNPSVAVPSALPGLASRFGMLLGVSPVL